MQRLSNALRNSAPKGSVRVVGVNEWCVNATGRSRPVGVVVEVGARVLGMELTGTEFDYRGSFESMADELGVDVIVADDSTDYSIPIEKSTLIRQQCLVHMKRTLGRAKGRIAENTTADCWMRSPRRSGSCRPMVRADS